MAAFHGRVDAVSLLLDRGADTDAKDDVRVELVGMSIHTVIQDHPALLVILSSCSMAAHHSTGRLEIEA